MKTIKILLTCAAALMLSSCAIRVNFANTRGKRIVGSQNYVTKTLPLEAFNALNLYGSLDIVCHTGEPKAVIKAPDNLIDYILVEVKDGTLSVKLSDSVSTFRADSLLIHIYTPNLEQVNTIGSGDIDFMDEIAPADSERTFTVKVTGSGDIEVAGCKARKIVASIAGSGDIEFKALQADSMTISIAGSGDFEAERINAGDVSVSIAGSGDVELSGRAKSASYSIAGSGTISASGLKVDGPVKTKISGSGEIN